jgi:hypothetical protein
MHRCRYSCYETNKYSTFENRQALHEALVIMETLISIMENDISFIASK